jgi:hypothetical protein
MTTKPLRLYTCLNAAASDAVRAAVGNPAQVRLWIVATSPREAARLLDERQIEAVWPVAGPVQQGPFERTFGGLGFLAEPTVYAYPVPHDDDSPVVRVDSPNTVEQVAVLGDVLAHLGAGLPLDPGARRYKLTDAGKALAEELSR